MSHEPCIGCGAEFPETDGPTHRYLESSAGCWACYGEILEREFSDLDYYAVHRLSVDTYALQHPGQPSPQTIQSAALHAMSLCAIFENGVELSAAGKVLQQGAKHKDRFEWLTPPTSRGTVTVADVHQAQSAVEHADLVHKWAESVWSAWSEHHPTFRTWLAEIW